MSDDRHIPRRPARSGIGSLTTIVLVFGFATIVVLIAKFAKSHRLSQQDRNDARD